ncbi:PLC-like phosphodiesterase [Cadophora sp. MPI-SDFR-AT-0126]|nr:PLC-like phosphodiesterase [Leotiomycetes sp. MPI-SDFR-AT-0126]
MSLPEERRSQDYLLSSQFCDDSAFGDFRSSSARSDEDDLHRKPPYQVELDSIEPFAFEELGLKGRRSIFKRVMTFVQIWKRQKENRSTLHMRPLNFKALSARTLRRRPRLSKCVLYVILAYLSILGLIQFLGSVLATLEVHFPDDVDWVMNHWGQVGESADDSEQWPTDAAGGVHPVNCHSHNDYWRSVPLYAAVHAGCTGVEADIWLVDDELYVGHTRHALTANRTLQNMYINPLLDLIGKQNPLIENNPNGSYLLSLPEENRLNGVFDVVPTQTLVLLIDFKSSDPALWRELNSQLMPFRERGYLTHFNGTAIIERPITIVGTGDAAFDLLTANDTYRDVFFDAPLEEMADLSSPWPNPNRAQDSTRGHGQQESDAPDSNMLDSQRTTTNTEPAGHDQSKSVTSTSSNASIYSPFNSYYASTSFTKSIGHVWGSRLTQEQLQLIRGQIRGAHQQGLRVRYWGLPQWPIGLRNHIWHILIREGVDMLNVDDLRHATERDWRRRKGWWY